MYLGLDGFRHGWVAASIDGRGKGNIEFLCDISQIDHRQFQMAMVDIPIGVPRFGNRSCDMAARELLGTNRTRVFTGARRPLLEYCHCREQANRIGKTLLVDGHPGAGVSCQLFCILKKIKEVDDFLGPDRQKVVRECHPELVFLRLNMNRPVPNKRAHDGRQCRRELLAHHIFDLNRLIDERLGTGAKEDDVLDAFACAVAAMDCADGKEYVVPAGPCCFDSRKLKMQIWY